MQGPSSRPDDDRWLDLAVDLAARAAAEGGIPIATVIVDDEGLLGQGTNQRVQRDSMVLHAEMAAFEDAGRARLGRLVGATLYTTLSPCLMCTGAITLFGIGRVVVAERRTFEGPTDLLRDHGIEVDLRDRSDAHALMERFRAEHPEVWAEDNGGR